MATASHRSHILLKDSSRMLLTYVTVMFISANTWLIRGKTSVFCVFLSDFGYRLFRFQYNKVLLWTCPIRTGSSFGKQGAVLIGVGIVPCKWGLLVVDISEQMFYNWDIATGKRVVVKGKCKT